MHRRTNALARAWSQAGLGPGDGVAILCRNHRGIVEATVACAKLGADAVFLNTAFAGPQIAAVCEREQPRAIVYDEDLADAAREAARGRLSLVGWSDGTGRSAAPRVEQLIETGDPADLPVPESRGRVVILTSGTTGAPKGAKRRQPASLDPAAALLASIPLRARERTLIAAPLFHSWGFAHLVLGDRARLDARPAPPLRRRGDPASDRRARGDRARRRAGDAPADARARRRRRSRATTSARCASSRRAAPRCRASSRRGSWTPSATCSTTSTARPRSRGRRSPRRRICARRRARRAPGAWHGRAPVRRLPAARSRAGDAGRIFVGNDMVFEGYTGGGRQADAPRAAGVR